MTVPLALSQMRPWWEVKLKPLESCARPPPGPIADEAVWEVKPEQRLLYGSVYEAALRGQVESALSTSEALRLMGRSGLDPAHLQAALKLIAPTGGDLSEAQFTAA